MYSPTTRVLTVLELLQTHGRLSGAELARRLEVDGRTLRRYIAKLEDLGIPVVAERGRYGCYSLVAGFKLPPMMFTDDEALALSIGLVAARSLGLAEAAPRGAKCASQAGTRDAAQPENPHPGAGRNGDTGPEPVGHTRRQHGTAGAERRRTRLAARAPELLCGRWRADRAGF
ncbi:HTH domain-containing protein [Polaromonas sp. P1-6]|nr:HTH domain-containing protein [Polaromonas sp. P1-6]